MDVPLSTTFAASERKTFSIMAVAQDTVYGLNSLEVYAESASGDISVPDLIWGGAYIVALVLQR